MAFGRAEPEEDYPTTMRWEGNGSSARAICAWARDEALLAYAAVTPPHRDAVAGTPGADWQMQLKVEVPPEQGGGTQWVTVPKGATIVHVNKGNRVDPVFAIQAPAQAAADTFKEET